MAEKIVKIELTEEEAELFKIFVKHFADFEKLLKAGFCDFKNGKMIIHRDFNGKLRKIEIERVIVAS